ncbi:MAG: Holliday junction branch migration DNA helicase RuvB [Candidatus Omnitrophota bacterium]
MKEKDLDIINPVFKNIESEEDVVLNLSLRPKNLTDFVGQKAIIDNLNISITAARQRNEQLEHLLLSGPPGLGKTTLAHIVAHEMNTKITATSGPAIAKAGDLIGILTNLEKGDILFIDEIHRLSKVVEEFLYPAMEEFQIDFVIDKGPYAKTIKFNLKPFTLVGATTRTGLLSSPLRTRFGLFHHVDFYSDDDLKKIIKNSSSLLNLKIDNDAAGEIAKRSRGTPRIANRLVRRIRDYAQVKKIETVDSECAIDALKRLGIDSAGLDEFDRKFLKVLIDNYNGGPVGVESLAATLNEENDTLIDTIEPFLLKAGFIKRTPRGREATELSFKHLNLTSKKLQKELF